MNELGEQLKELIKERFNGVPGLARQLGMSEQTIYSMCRNGVTGSSLNTVVPVADALGIDPSELMRGRITPVSPDAGGFVNVPLFGSIVPGKPADPLGDDGTYPIPAKLHERHPQAFLLRVAGDSMDRVLPERCYALVDPCTDVEHPGQPYAVAVGAKAATVKRVRPLANGIELRPDSNDPTYQNQVFDFGDAGADEVSVIGRVVWYTLPIDWDFGTSR